MPKTENFFFLHKHIFLSQSAGKTVQEKLLPPTYISTNVTKNNTAHGVQKST